MRVCRYFLITLLILSLVSLAFINLAVAQQKATSVIVYNNIQDYQKATGKKIDKFSEAPMLADLVKQGKLPPVEQRLPQEPLVVAPLEEIGQYGGTWRRAAVGVSDVGIINSRITYENLVRWSADGKKVVPNVATKWKIEDGGKTFTFYLRKGIKWSDGQPFTAEDIVFWYKEVLLNKDLTPTFPTWLTVDGKPGKVEKVDDYTIRFKFDAPYGLFMQILAGPNALGITQYPAHYLKQFHINYTPKEKLEAMAKEAGFQLWHQLFSNKQSWQNPDCPRIWAWVITTPPPSNIVIATRNPYYWKIDTAGNQLPYIDKIRFDIVENVEVLNMKAMAGEIDMQFRHIVWTNYTLFMENREKGNYRVLKWTSAEGSNALLMPNLNHKDPVLRKLFENLDFRRALSLAINRDEINQIAYLGMGKPRQAAVIPQCPYYKPEYEKAYAEYNPAKANQLLDKIGLTKRDKDGFRLRPDGKTLTVTIEYAPIFGPWTDVVTMVKKYWESVGIKTLLKEESRDLFTTRAQAGELDIGIWTMDRCFTPLVEPLYWLPGMPSGTPPNNANEYWRWYRTGGKEGEKPPEDIVKVYQLYDKAKSTTNETARTNYAHEIMRLNAKNLWVIGIVGVLPQIVIVKNNFRNVPEDAIQDWLQLTEGNTYPEQYFFKIK